MDSEVDTVDGLQGPEKETVLVSLVRSNDTNTVGFLTETRRFNVTITRARRKLVVVGDLDTIGAEPVYDRFARYAKNYGHGIGL